MAKKITYDKLKKELIDVFSNVVPTMFADAIGKDLQNEIKHFVEHGEYKTLNPNFIAIGMVHTGEYLESIKEINEGNKSIVYTTDPKGKKLEYGTEADENKGLRSAKLIKWADDKGIPNPVVAGKRIAERIRKEGTVEKAHWRPAVQSVKFGNKELVDEIKPKIIQELKRRFR